MLKNIFYNGLIASLLILQGCIHLETQLEPVYLDATRSTDERIDDLMERMTLSEKVAQMCQYVGFNYLEQVPAQMSAEEILKSDSQASYKGYKTSDLAQMVVDGEIGSFLHVLTPQHANQLQALASKSRLKIPLLLGIDAIHGNGMVRGVPFILHLFHWHPLFQMNTHIESVKRLQWRCVPLDHIGRLRRM